MVANFLVSDGCFLLNAGKIIKRSILTVTALTVNAVNILFLFDLILDFGSQFDHYLHGVRDICINTKKLNINIVGIVSENLSGQTKVITYKWSKNIQNKLLELKISYILDV